MDMVDVETHTYYKSCAERGRDSSVDDGRRVLKPELSRLQDFLKQNKICHANLTQLVMAWRGPPESTR